MAAEPGYWATLGVIGGALVTATAQRFGSRVDERRALTQDLQKEIDRKDIEIDKKDNEILVLVESKDQLRQRIFDLEDKERACKREREALQYVHEQDQLIILNLRQVLKNQAVTKDEHTNLTYPDSPA